MTERIYVECEDPRVLAEHPTEKVQNNPGSSDRWSFRGSDWPSSEGDYARYLSNSWRYRLVFSSPEEAGRGLVDYRDRLGARLLWTDDGESWEMSKHTAASIAEDLATCGVRIAAPAAPAEEPRPEPWVLVEAPMSGDALRMAAREWDRSDPQDAPGRSERMAVRGLLRRWADEHDAAQAVAALDAPARPALPEGVEPFGWTRPTERDPDPLPILWSQHLPGDWQYGATQKPADPIEWYPLEKRPSPNRLVLARPVPEPETERVPWWEAVGRRLCGPQPRIVEKVQKCGGERAFVQTHEDDDGIGHGRWAESDGTVEVIREAP